MSEGKLKHLTSVRQISRPLLEELMRSADEMRTLVRVQGGDSRLQHKVLAAAFLEPSTRTSCSFQSAMLRLGGTVFVVNSEHSSVKKGESLEDTIRTLSCFADVIVLRHSSKGSASTASAVSRKSIINAGDGVGEHPSQALLDVYTIKTELGCIGSSTPSTTMTVALLGDLKNG